MENKSYPSPAKVLTFIALVFAINSEALHSQPVSLGGAYKVEDKVLWLKAEDILKTNNELVEQWPDASIYGHHAVSSGVNRPVFRTDIAGFDNKPVVEFNQNPGDNHMLNIADNAMLEGMNGLTIITVFKSNHPNPDAFQGIISKSTNHTTRHSWGLYLRDDKKAQFKINNSRIDPTLHGGWNSSFTEMLSSVFSGERSTMTVFQRGNRRSFATRSGNLSINRNVGTPVTIGNSGVNSSDGYQGHIAEILVIREELNPAQLLIVENILALKYDLTMRVPAYFHLGFFKSNPTFSHDLIGIGSIVNDDIGFRKHSSSHGNGAGLYISEAANSLDEDNEFIYAGHNGFTHTVVTTDLPPGETDIEHRWARIWRVQRRNTPGQGNGTSIRLGFDFDEASLPVDSERLYVLLFRENATGNFIRLPISSGAAGGRVTFTIPDELFRSGYYTIARSSSIIKTWSSIQSGLWEDPSTWEGNQGFPGQNPTNDRADNVIINNNHVVTLSTNGKTHGDMWIKEGGRLAMYETRNHFFNTIRGKGRIIITGNYFPDGDGTMFNTTGGGTVQYVGNTNYLFNTPRQFNNLEISLDDPNHEMILTRDFNISGNLIIQQGTLRINNDISQQARRIHVSENLIIDQNGRLLTGTANISPERHKLIIEGDFINYGTARFSNLTGPSYTSDAPNGMIDVVFNHPTRNQKVQAFGLTEFYRIEIAKGILDSLFLQADAPGRFFLWGPNNYSQLGGNWPPNLPNPNALGLLSGVLVLEDNIHIPSIKTIAEIYYIDQDAQIVINGGRLDAPFTNGQQGIAVHGSLVVLDGLLRVEARQGVNLFTSGTFEVKGGLAQINMFRVAGAGAINMHRGGYIQTGGRVEVLNITPDNDGNPTHYRFSMPYEENTFIMTGGELIVSSTRTTNRWGLEGGILINSSTDNQIVTGGTVTAVIDKTRNYIINSSVPFYNLKLIREIDAVRNFYISGYPHPQSDDPEPGDSNPPPAPVGAHPLRVLNRLTLTGGSRSANLDLRGHELVVSGDILIENGSMLLADNSRISFTGTGNSRLEIQNNSDILTTGSFIINKTSPSDTLTLVRTHMANSEALLNVTDLLNVQRGVLDYKTYQVNLLGDLHLNGTLGTNHSQGMLSMEGFDPQQIIASNTEINTYIGHLAINNGAGISLHNNSIGKIGKLSLIQGVFNLGTQGIHIENAIYGSGFNASKMIATAGGHTNKGLSLWIATEGDYTFPIGTTAKDNPRYTPLHATFRNVTEGLYVQVNPVDNELSTLANADADSALTYYWRIRHSAIQNLPNVEQYVFGFHPSNLPNVNPLPEFFVPGKVVNSIRSFEEEANFNLIQYTITFNNGGVPFLLETGEYTAGQREKFIGRVQTFFSRQNGDFHNPLVWSLSNHNSFDNPLNQIPGVGDLVQIGISGAIAHKIDVGQNVSIAGLQFNHFEELLPELSIEDRNVHVELGTVLGTGSLVQNFGEHIATISGDFSDFVSEVNSRITYKAVEAEEFHIPVFLSTYPNLFLMGPDNGMAELLLPDEDKTVRGNLYIQDNIRALLSDTPKGNITVMGNMNIGVSGNRSELFFRSTGEPRHLHIKGNLTLDGNANSGIGVLESETDLLHHLTIEGSIYQNAGSITLFTGSNRPRADLELAGLENALYTRSGGERPILYRIKMNKKEKAKFSFNRDFIFDASTVQPVVLLNGVLELASAGIEINLTRTSAGDFVIPETAGLILSSDSRAQANSTNSGITLNGLLRIQDNARLLMTGESSTAYIEYGPTLNSRLEISGNARLEVGTQIRGFIENDNNVLKYKQDGGSVLVGRRQSTYKTRGVFEIHNPGSSFHFTGGTITIGQGYHYEPGFHRLGVYLHAADFLISENATMIFGTGNSPLNYNLHVSASNPLPNVEIKERGFRVEVVSDNLAIHGNLTIFPGQSFIAQGKNITLKGNLLNNGTVNLTNSTVILSGESQSISGLSIISFDHLTASPYDRITLNTDIFINGDFTILDGVFDDMGYNITTLGNINNLSIHESSSATGGIMLKGHTQQGIEGTGQFGRVTLDNYSGAILHSPIFINDALYVNAGVLNIQNFLLTLGPNCVINENIANYNNLTMIQSNGNVSSQGVRRHFNTPGEFIIPLGVSGRFTPVRISASTMSSGSYIQVANINQKHPNVILPGNLNYYWRLNSLISHGFTGNLYFHYHQGQVEPDESAYLPARLYNDYWSKLTTDQVDVSANIINFPYADAVTDITGDYTAGSSIPDQIFIFRSISGGEWTNPDIWENITPGVNTPAPEGGPLGQKVIVSENHQITTGSSPKTVYQTIINGNLIVNSSSSAHYLGSVSGSGKLEIFSSSLPLGEFEGFAEGTFMFSGSLSYNLDPARFPQNGIRNLIMAGSGLRVLPAGNFRINGNFELQDNVQVDLSQNNTILQLKGNLIKNPQSILSTGSLTSISTVLFDGNTSQTISGNFTDQSKLNIMRINNPEGVSLEGMVEVINRLEFHNGRLFTSSVYPVRLLNYAVATGVSASRFVNGPIQKTGSSRFVFPTGKNDRLGRIAFRPATGGNLSPQTILEAEYFTSIPPYFQSADAELVQISSAEYWLLKPVDMQKSGQVAGHIELYMDDKEYSGINHPEMIKVGWYDAANTFWRSQGGTYNPGWDYIRSSVVDLNTNSGLFTFGSDPLINPLPIEILSFTAREAGTGILLEWSTATERNNDYFSIERSSDGIHFETIGYVTGAGNSNSIILYNHFDGDPLSGISYYRLKQTDFDGSFEYSDIIAVQIKGSTIHRESTLLVYPNPVVDGRLNIYVSSFDAEEQIQVRVSDMFGRVIITERIVVDDVGSSLFTLENLQSLQPGMYLVIVQNKTKRLNERIIIK